MNDQGAGTASGERLRVRGTVQGVGFRPVAWRLATELGLKGDVRNDGDGVLIRLAGPAPAREAFIARLRTELPSIACIESLERVPLSDTADLADAFRIIDSEATGARTGVPPDVAVCPRCVAETLDPGDRRYRYPFTNCTHCGPRLSIIRAIPYDRANTAMARFVQCPECASEYADPADRRFHAQPNACAICGPSTTLRRGDGTVLGNTSTAAVDDIDAAADLLLDGAIVAVKGIGGFHLAADATNAAVVERLRRQKYRYDKPLAMMARDVDMVRRYCEVGPAEEALLRSAEAPIVILTRRTNASADAPVAAGVAPGQPTLGFMLPYTPLHVLLLERFDRPLVLTSGNRSEEPQCIDNDDARCRLDKIADYFLTHDRDIVNRLDDSVVRVMAGAPRMLRRARGYAPGALPLPAGIEDASGWLALGGELKNTFCLLTSGRAVLSQHMGDLEDAATYADFEKNLELYAKLYQHRPTGIAIDRHPEYLSAKLGRERAAREGLPLVEVQHHHAHVAACLAENGRRLDAPPVLGIALDGLGYGENGQLWGGEFLRADYSGYDRLATFKPVAMPGGAMAMREPWRNTFSHLDAAFGWDRVERDHGSLEIVAFLRTRPLPALRSMLSSGRHAPAASSCGRLFDAVAAALGLCREHATYEGQAAIALEAAIDDHEFEAGEAACDYPFTINETGDLASLEPREMWRALLQDLERGTRPGVISARFHRGLAAAIVAMAGRLARTTDTPAFDTVALSGGVFQNRALFERVAAGLESDGFTVLSHRRVPANDGGIALGQAVVAAAGAVR